METFHDPFFVSVKINGDYLEKGAGRQSLGTLSSLINLNKGTEGFYTGLKKLAAAKIQ